MTHTLSRYLVSSPLPHHKRRRFRPPLWLRYILWRRPRFGRRSAKAVAIITFIIGIGATFSAPFGLVDGQPRAQALLGPSAALAAAPEHPASLPGGPSGQALPPGYLAPMGTFGNRYAAGNCTWYVASRRSVPTTWGNARTWLPRARAAGWTTGTTPAVGAIAWTSAGSLGHVAVVEAVDGGMVTVAEMNYYGLYRVSHRTVSATSFQYIY